MNKKEDDGVRFQIARTSLANERTFLIIGTDERRSGDSQTAAS